MINVDASYLFICRCICVCCKLRIFLLCSSKIVCIVVNTYGVSTLLRSYLGEFFLHRVLFFFHFIILLAFSDRSTIKICFHQMLNLLMEKWSSRRLKRSQMQTLSIFLRNGKGRLRRYSSLDSLVFAVLLKTFMPLINDNTQNVQDLPRTFPGHLALDENGRNALRRLLTAYARHNPSVGYCQVLVFKEHVIFVKKFLSFLLCDLSYGPQGQYAEVDCVAVG